MRSRKLLVHLSRLPPAAYHWGAVGAESSSLSLHPYPQPWLLPRPRLDRGRGFCRVSAMAIPAVCDDSSALPQCPGCRQRDARIIQLEQQLVALQAENRKLAERVGRNAFNSSIPPSAQPLDAPKFPKKKPSGRNRGGQPGHRARTRTLLPTTHVDAVVPFVPANCERCQAPLAAEPQAGDPPPHRHQIVELPPQLIHVTEYQGQGAPVPLVGTSPGPSSPPRSAPMRPDHAWSPLSPT